VKKIAIFGFGNHVKKNILPAISRSNNLDISYIVRRNINDSAKEEYKNIKFITLDESFEKINHKNTNLVYIANPTSEHYIWSKESIFNKYDVLCEKPLTNSHEDTKHLIKLAQENSVNINEVCIYKFHKQYLYLKELVESSWDDIESIETSFCIPSLPDDDFRYQKDLGGGALLDLGYYPVSIILSLFGEPEGMSGEIYRNLKLNIDTGGDATLKYQNFTAKTKWRLGSEYENFFKITFKRKEYIFYRIFSKPHDYESTVIFTDADNLTTEIKIGKDDHFLNILESDSSSSNNDDELLIAKYLEVISHFPISN